MKDNKKHLGINKPTSTEKLTIEDPPFSSRLTSKDRPSARPPGNDRGCENKSNQECHRACREILYTETEPWSQRLLEHKTGLD